MQNNTEENVHLFLDRVALGDQVAFRKVYDVFFQRLVSFSYAIIKQKDAAIEAVDEVFIRFWKNRANAATIQNLKVYLYTATKNASLNYLEAQAREQLTAPFDNIDTALTEEYNPEKLMITAELFQKIHNAVEDLPPRCKMIFKLVREDGLKYKEVAEILNVTVNTVDAQMVIAVKRISEKVRGHFDLFPKVKVKTGNG